ncbi:MAG: RHS repeat-associated core domain-containing protein [Proteobacteria bacterium]|nr:RHS repeat-associated core domain-containing protein [Pseudomonadota bacterium]
MPDHLGSSDSLLNEAGAAVARESFGTFGTRRGSNWSATTAPDWLGIANTTRQGFTGHDMLDNVGLVHMNGRVYDPALGRFLSADPLIGDLGDSQSVNPYAYVGNRPLNASDPTGYLVDGGLSIYVGKFVVDSILTSLAYGLLSHGGLPPPPATALPGWSAQSGVGLCGAGTFSPTCGGTILYAGAPGTGRGGVPTSTWAETSVDDEYARENLERFFLDLGINAVDILILSPVHDARDAYDAARRGTTRLPFFMSALPFAMWSSSVSRFWRLRRRCGAQRVDSTRWVHTQGGRSAMMSRSRVWMQRIRQVCCEVDGRYSLRQRYRQVHGRTPCNSAVRYCPTEPLKSRAKQVKRGTFSAPSTVAPYRLPNGTILNGGGTERTAVGDVPVRILRVDEL